MSLKSAPVQVAAAVTAMSKQQSGLEAMQEELLAGISPMFRFSVGLTIANVSRSTGRTHNELKMHFSDSSSLRS